MQQIDWQTLAEGRTDASQLAEMRREWPYFVWPDLMALEHGVAEAGQAQALRARIALATGDPEALARVLDPDTDFADFYPDMQPVRLTTDDTIDTFLNRFGNTGDDKETDLLTRMIFTPPGVWRVRSPQPRVAAPPSRTRLTSPMPLRHPTRPPRASTPSWPPAASPPAPPRP